MSDLTFGVKLEGNSSTLVSETRAARDEFVALQKQTDSLNASNVKMASGYSGLDAAVKQHTAAVKETEGGVNKLLDRYDPLGAKLRQLQADFKALDAAAAGGKIAGRDDGRVDQVYARLQAEINATSAAASNMGVVASGAMNKTTLSAGQLRMATQQLPMQFTDIWVSLAAGQSPMMVMLQQGTQIKDSFGGVGNAAKAMGGYILGLINPITLTAAAVAAGGYAWYRWGEDAKEAAAKALDASEKIKTSAEGGVSKTIEEKMGDLYTKIYEAQDKIRQRQKEMGDHFSVDELLNFQKGIAAYERQIADLKVRQTEEAERDAKRNKPKADKTDPNQSFIDTLQRESDTYGMTAGQIKIYEAAKKGIVGTEMQQVMVLAEEKDARDAATQAAKDQTKADQDLARAVSDANKIIGDIDPTAKATQEWEKLLALKAQGLLTDEQIAKSYAKSFGEVEKSGTDTYSALEAAARGWGNGFTNELARAVQSGKGSFASLRDSIIADMLKIAIQKNITDNLMNWGATGLKAAGTYVAGLFSKNANGNAFGSDGVMAFANGGAFTNQIISEPTYFAYGGALGKLGQVGEAGPEAIMPLSRGSDGKLGVRMDGGGGSSQIIIQQPITIDARGADAGVEQRIRSIMPALLMENQRIIVASVQSAQAAKGKTL